MVRVLSAALIRVNRRAAEVYRRRGPSDVVCRIPRLFARAERRGRNWLATLAEDGDLSVFDHRSIQAKIDGIAAGLPPETRVERESGSTEIWIGAALAGAGLLLGSDFAWRWFQNRRTGF